MNGLKHWTVMSTVRSMRLTIMFLMAYVTSSDLPTISLLQKSPSSPITCHATGFYPDRAVLFWTKDGEEVTENVDAGEILPNHDGTFQKSVELDVSSVKSGDWGKYSCVFHFTDGKETIITKLDKAEIKSNHLSPSTKFPFGPVIGAVIGFLILAIIFVGVLKVKQNNSSQRPLCCSDTPV